VCEREKKEGEGEKLTHYLTRAFLLCISGLAEIVCVAKKKMLVKISSINLNLSAPLDLKWSHFMTTEGRTLLFQ
jgi:hypothetical protein